MKAVWSSFFPHLLPGSGLQSIGQQSLQQLQCPAEVESQHASALRFGDPTRPGPLRRAGDLESPTPGIPQ
jgi:hypothetical protein